MVVCLRQWLIGPDSPQPVRAQHGARCTSFISPGTNTSDPDQDAGAQSDFRNGPALDAREGRGWKEGPLMEEQRESWRSQVGSKVVQYAWDKLCGSLVQQWVYNTWYAALTPDREFPAEVSHFEWMPCSMLRVSIIQKDLLYALA